MTVSANQSVSAGSVDLSVSFSAPDPGLGALDLSQVSAGNLAIFSFGPFDTNTYWIEQSTTDVPETYLTLKSISGSTGAPFELAVGARLTAGVANYPVDGQAFNTSPGNSWLLFTRGRDPDYFDFPYPLSGATLGMLVTRHRVTSNIAADGTITIPMSIAPFNAQITDQSWTGYLNVYVWISRKFTSTNPYIDFYINESGSRPALYLPTETLSVPNRDTGRSGNAYGSSPYARDPISGLTLPDDRLVDDGFRRGVRVSPDFYDPIEPPRRPSRPERPR